MEPQVQCSPAVIAEPVTQVGSPLIRVPEAIAALHSAIQDHPTWRRTVPGGVAAERVDYVIAADDEGRTVDLAVLPVAVPRLQKAD